MKFSVYEVGQNSSFVLFVTEISYHMYRKNAVLNGKQKQMKPLLVLKKVRKNSWIRRFVDWEFVKTCHKHVRTCMILFGPMEYLCQLLVSLEYLAIF